MESLASFLGVQDPRPEEQRSTSDFEQLLDITDPKIFCQRILASREFRQYIMNGIVLSDLAPAVMCRVIDHAWGKPVERVEVTDTTIPVEGLRPEDLEMRASRLAEMARLMRRAEEFDEPLGSDSVH